MFGFIIDDTVTPQSRQELQPPPAQATQRIGVRVALVAFGLIIDVGPATLLAAFVHPQVHGRAQGPITGPANVGLANLTGLVADRADAGQAKQTVRMGKQVSGRANFPQQPRGQFVFGAGQRAKEVVVGVSGKGLGNLPTVFLELALQAFQHGDQAQGQQAFGGDGGRAGIELLACRPARQPFRSGFRAPEFVDVEEGLPASLACLGQRGRVGKGPHEGPGKGLGPVRKAVQRQGVIFGQGGLELIDQGGALFNQDNLVAAQQAQGGGRRILGLEREPGVAVGAQGISQAPGVVPVGLGAAGGFAFPIAFGRFGINRIDRIVALQQLIDDHPAGSFNRHRTRAKGLHLLCKLRPTLSGVGELKVGHHGADPIHDDDVMVIFGPIQGRIIRLFGPMSIHSAQGAQWHRHSRRARPDTGALTGRCSLST